MSMTSCEIASSQRSASGGDFQCTPEELYNSFMEIVVNQEQQLSINAQGRTENATDKRLSGESNVISSDEMSEATVSEATEATEGTQCHEPKVDENKDEPVALSPEWNDVDNSLNQAYADLNVLQEDEGVSVGHNEVLSDDVEQRKSGSDPSKASALLLGINQKRRSHDRSSTEETNNNILFSDSVSEDGLTIRQNSLEKHDDVFSDETPLSDLPEEKSVNNDQLSELEVSCSGDGSSQSKQQGSNTNTQETGSGETTEQEINQQEMAPNETNQPLRTEQQVLDQQGTSAELTNSQSTDSQETTPQVADTQAVDLKETGVQSKDRQHANSQELTNSQSTDAQETTPQVADTQAVDLKETGVQSKDRQHANSQELTNSQTTDSQVTTTNVAETRAVDAKEAGVQSKERQQANSQELTNSQTTDSQETATNVAEKRVVDPKETGVQSKDLQQANSQEIHTQESKQDELNKHSIDDDIQEGIRKASQVCEEITEYIHLNRMSQCSDGILNESDLPSPEPVFDNENKLSVSDTPGQDPGAPDEQESTSEIINEDKQKEESVPQVPAFIKVSASEDSSSTCSSIQDGSQHSDELDERKQSTSDSLGSSEGSLSGDTKNTGMSPSSEKPQINWDILNTAFGNCDTDEDEGEICEVRRSYGGFGLMLDENAPQRLTAADNRLRSVSESSTMSESKFQQEYQKQHVATSLDRKKDAVLFSGYLLKLGGTGITPKNWRKRWCILRHDRCLYYYKTVKDNVPSGIIVLTNYTVSRGHEFHKKHCLKLSKGGGRTYFFCAGTSTDMMKWMDVLRKAANVIDEGMNFDIREEVIHNVAIPALSIKNPDCHGYLTKQGGRHRNSWKRRYCVLKSGCLYYYREMADTTALGVAKLHGYTLEEVTFPGKRCGFRALAPHPGMRTFSFMADNDYDRKRWIPCLEQSIQAANSSS